MKQTAVEIGRLKLNMLFTDITEEQWNKAEKLFQQAKEMEKREQNDFAIGFAEWCLDENHIILNDGKELLEIYKKEKGL
jgi:hypothetical protein